MRNDLDQQTKAPSRGTEDLEPSSATPRSSQGGFSLVEVTLAIGIVAFAFTAVVGLLPVGMRTAQDGQDQARATEILNTAAAAIYGQRPLPASGQFAFGDWLNGPDDTPTTYSIGGGSLEKTDLKVTEAGNIRRAAGTTSPVSHSMFLRVVPPPTNSEKPVEVYLSVAWPGTAEWDSSNKEWTKHQGHVETLLYANPPISL